MRNVPSLPPPTTVPEEMPGVIPLGQGKAVRRVTEPGAPPLIKTSFPPPPPRPTLENTQEQPPQETRSGRDRRKICRRVDHKGEPLMDTRASGDRRHRNRRKGDIKTNVEDDA